MVVTLNDPLCTLINICLREKHKPARKLISFDTNALGLVFIYFTLLCTCCFFFLSLSLIDGSRFITVPNNRHVKHNSHNNNNTKEQQYIMESDTHKTLVYTRICLKYTANRQGFFFVLCLVGVFFNPDVTFICACRALQSRFATQKAVSAIFLLYKLPVPGHLGKKKHFFQDLCF